MTVRIHDDFYPLDHFLMSLDVDIFAIMISSRYGSPQAFVDRYVSLWETAYDTPFNVL